LRKPGETMDDTLCRLPAHALRAKIAAKDVSPVEAVRAVLARIEASQPVLNAFITVCADEALAAAQAAEGAVLRGDKGGLTTTSFMWITTVAQMGMGFILPFALTFVAIPLETFVHSLRTVMGLAGGALLRALAVGLRVLGGASYHLGQVLVDVYDMVIFLPLWVERRVRAHGLIDHKDTEAYSAREVL